MTRNLKSYDANPQKLCWLSWVRSSLGIEWMPQAGPLRREASRSLCQRHFQFPFPKKHAIHLPIHQRRFLWLGAVRSCWFGWNSLGPISAKHGHHFAQIGIIWKLGSKTAARSLCLEAPQSCCVFYRAKRSKNAPHLTKGITSVVNSAWSLQNRI